MLILKIILYICYFLIILIVIFYFNHMILCLLFLSYYYICIHFEQKRFVWSFLKQMGLCNYLSKLCGYVCCFFFLKKNRRVYLKEKGFFRIKTKIIEKGFYKEIRKVPTVQHKPKTNKTKLRRFTIIMQNKMQV